MYYIHWESSSHPDALPFSTLDEAIRVARFAQNRDRRDFGNYDNFRIVAETHSYRKEFQTVYDSTTETMVA